MEEREEREERKGRKTNDHHPDFFGFLEGGKLRGRAIQSKGESKDWRREK